MKKTTCPECKEKYNIEEDEAPYLTLDGKTICNSCYEADQENPSMLFKFTPNDDPEKFYISQLFGGFTEDYEHMDEYPEPVKKEVWKKTDGWRGYTDWELLPDFIEFADGWITGYPDETTARKKELSDYYEDLLSGKLKPPTTIYWIFGSTSNVFSTASTIIIKKSDKKILIKWLEDINGGLDHFKELFN